MTITVLFLSHGAPPLLVEEREIVGVMRALGAEFHRRPPDVILVASPHWISSDDFLVHTAPQPECIQDYYGFPEEFYEYHYEVSNDVALAERLIAAGREAGLPVRGTEEWGLDHGAWLPLYVMFPEAEIPVVPLATSEAHTSEVHARWGEVLRHAATDKREVLFLGTGSTVHRLDQLRSGYEGDDLYPPGQALDDLLLRSLEESRLKEVLRVQDSHPTAFQQAAPEAGLRTLFLTLGVAGEGARAEVLSYEPWYYGVSLLAVRFWLAKGT